MGIGVLTMLRYIPLNTPPPRFSGETDRVVGAVALEEGKIHA